MLLLAITAIILAVMMSECICCTGAGRSSQGLVPELPQATPGRTDAVNSGDTVPEVSPMASETPTLIPLATPTPVPASLPEPRSLPTGTILANSAGSGYGELLVINKIGYDSAFIMAKNTTPMTPQFGVYIGKYDTYKISGIPDGTYIMYYMAGQDWDSDEKSFTRCLERARWDQLMNYTTRETDTEINYTIYTLTMGPPGESNASVVKLGSAEFPEL